MAGPALSQIIADAIANSFKEKGLIVHVWADEWAVDRSKPLKFTNGTEVYLTRAESSSKPRARIEQQKRIA